MNKNLTQSARRRVGTVALGLGLIFGAAACGGADEPAGSIDLDSIIEDIDIEAELEAWENFDQPEFDEILEGFGG